MDADAFAAVSVLGNGGERRHTSGMTPAASSTTIKVPVPTRDRLRGRAQEHGETLAEHIDKLLDLGERELRFAELQRAIESMTDEERAAGEAELDEWLSADLS